MMSDLPGCADRSVPPATVDVDAVLDQSAFTLLQRFIVVLIALVIVLDGFDSQLLGFAIPLMMQDWGLPRDAFTLAVTASSVGMVAGSIVSGLWADKIGRRWMILLTLSICSIATCLIGTASGVTEVILFRFFAGLGIGGALPVCTTMSAEFAPVRYRTVVVTASIVCVPLGGMLAGLFSNLALYSVGWRLIFYIGGALPLALLVLLWFVLPESPRFLARYHKRWGELRRLLALMGQPVAKDTVFTDAAEQKIEKSRGGFCALLRNGLARDTISIWFAFFFCMLAIYAVFGWLPTILASGGISGVDAGYGLTVYNLGGVIGSLICAWGISWFGSWRALATCAIGGALSVFAMLSFDIGSNISLMLVLLALHGLFANAVQSPLYALAAYLYPTRIRATGTATAAAFGRAGAICAGFSGGLIGGISGYFILLGISMFFVLIALACIRRHIPAMTMLRRQPSMAVANKI